nr:NAD-binding protein [Halomonas sp. MCCC 1A13316]
MGKTISNIGSHGAGQTCKVANQIVVALTIEAVAEGLLFTSKAGGRCGQGARVAARRPGPVEGPRCPWRADDQPFLRPGL